MSGASLISFYILMLRILVPRSLGNDDVKITNKNKYKKTEPISISKYVITCSWVE